MDEPRTRSTSPWLVAVLGVGVGGIGAVAVLLVLGALFAPRAGEGKDDLEKPHTPFPQIQLARGPDGKVRLDTLVVPQAVLDVLHVGAVQRAKRATERLPLVMPGSTALDPSRIGRVRARFSGEVREIMTVNEPAPPGSAAASVRRELRTGDSVERGKPVGILWSVDVGSKKSDLVDALVQLDLDKKRLEARRRLYERGSIPEDTLNQTLRDVVTDQTTVERARRTLETWQIPPQEIDAVEKEAQEVIKRDGVRDPAKEKGWARSELVAPNSGTIVERNISVGEIISDATVNLFVIADVDNLLVLAAPPEDRLPDLVRLPPAERIWYLNTVGVPPDHKLPFEDISYLIDPGQHTALVKGSLPNRDYLANHPAQPDPARHPLRAGQFLTATVFVDPPLDVVEIPLSALVEDGGRRSYLFVQPDPDKPEYSLRRVLVTNRFATKAFIKSRLQESDRKPTQEDIALSLPVPEPLEQGMRYLPSGILELRAALEDLKVQAAPNKSEPGPVGP